MAESHIATQDIALGIRAAAVEIGVIEGIDDGIRLEIFVGDR